MSYEQPAALPAASPSTAPTAGRLRHHVLPALVVGVGATVVSVLVLAVFTLVFAADDAVTVREVLQALAGAVGGSIGLAAACFVLGVGLDRLTAPAPAVVRWLAPVPLPIVGLVVAFAFASSVGPFLVLLGVVLCGYWVVFLAQALVLRIGRRVLAGVRGGRPG